ncbi:MAG: DUF3592 domain-containing protein [Verrucomicrobiota bacterium]
MTRRSRQRPRAGASRDAHVAGPLVLYAGILFCLAFAAVGAHSVIRSLAPWFWKSVPCEVMRFEVEDHAHSALPFTASARYRFEWQGSLRESTRVGIEGWKNATPPLALARQFSEAPASRCYLPGGLPENAVLLRPPPRWTGLLFICFGACTGWILVQANRTRDLPQEEIARRILPAIALLFGGPGLAMTLGMSLPVWAESLQVLGWTDTPATVAWSVVRETRNSKSTHYRADICYEYRAAGKTWRNNSVRPGDVTGFFSSSAARLVASHPAGMRTRCHVHPTRPERALLLAGPGPAGLFTLFPLPFLAIGILCAGAAIRARKPPH